MTDTSDPIRRTYPSAIFREQTHGLAADRLSGSKLEQLRAVAGQALERGGQ